MGVAHAIGIEIAHHPERPRPFTLEIAVEHTVLADIVDGAVIHHHLTERLTYYLTNEQMETIFDRAYAPLMRARAARSTPGLVHP